MDNHTLSYQLAEAAFKHPNDIISNGLARLSDKIDKHGDDFPKKLTKVEKQILEYFLENNSLIQFKGEYNDTYKR